MKKRLFIVDDHVQIAQGLTQLFDREFDLAVCGQATSAAQGLADLRALKPDLALIDLSLKASHGLDLIKDVQTFLPDMRMLVVSMHDELVYAERVLRAGAAGYVMKSEPFECVLAGVRQVLNGQYFVSEAVKTRSLHQLAGAGSSRGLERAGGINSLSDREMQIFTCIGQGKRTCEIAVELHLSAKTVETHRAHLKQKLQLKTSAALVCYAVEWAHCSRG